MVRLYQVDSPINREQRNNINATFADILIRFTNLKYQISILAGGEDLDEILQRIEDTITNANNTTANTQQVLNDISDALSQLDAALQNSSDSTQSANIAASDAQNAVLDMQTFINQLGNAETYDNSKTYLKNNIVEYNGSSFIALQQTTGNLPPTLPTKRNNYWQLIAQRGVDGAGSVSSVNGQSPDVQGNISLTPQDISAVGVGELVIDIKNPPAPLAPATVDGVTDDTAAIKAMIDYIQTKGRGILYHSGGITCVSDTLVITGIVSIKGVGAVGVDIDWENPFLGVGSGFKWIGTTAKPMFQVNGMIGGMSWSDFGIDGNNVASYGIELDRLQQSEFSNLSITRFQQGLRIIPKTTEPHDNTMFNVFNRLSIYKCGTCLHLNGTADEMSNVCHNTFVNLVCDYTGSEGIYLGDCDNNAFITVVLFRRSGSGPGIYFAPRSRSNYLYHVQAGAGGAAAETGSKNIIFGYDRENGQPMPTIAQGADLSYTSNGLNSGSWLLNNPITYETKYEKLRVNGRISTYSFETTTPIQNDATVVLTPGGNTRGISRKILPVSSDLIAVGVTLSEFVNSGTFIVKIKDNETVKWSQTINYPTGNNIYFTFNLENIANPIALLKDHTLAVEIDAQGAFGPSNTHAIVDLYVAI